MSFVDTFVKLSKQLLPGGRAFKMPPSGDDSPPTVGMLEVLHRALARSESRVYEAGLSIFDSMLPDNDNFTADDATDWERRLALYSAPGTSLADRKAAIKVKMRYPGNTAARQHYAFIQAQLRDAGFDVYVYENRFLEGSPPGYITKTPAEVLGIAAGNASLGGFSLGELNLGSQWADDGITIVANYLEEALDAEYGFDDNLRATFFIAGATVSTFANVSAVRKVEFRKLLLELKPLHAVGYLFINYT